MLRYDSPIELGISRFTTADVTIGDVTIPGGGDVVWQVNPHLRGPAALPVRWTAP